MYHYTECGLPKVYLANGYKIHRTHYGKGAVIENLKGLHEAIGLSLIANPDRLDGKEIWFLRTEMLLSQASLADILQVAEITVRKWEAGDNRPTPTADVLLRALYKEHVRGVSNIREIVEELNSIERNIHVDERMKFKETSRGWKAA